MFPIVILKDYNGMTTSETSSSSGSLAISSRAGRGALVRMANLCNTDVTLMTLNTLLCEFRRHGVAHR